MSSPLGAGEGGKERGQKGGLKLGANFPCCIKTTFQEAEGGKGSSRALSRRFLRVFGLSDEAMPRKGVNLFKITPKQQKIKCQSHRAAPRVPSAPREGCWEVALPCPGSQPGPPSSCSSPATGPLPGSKSCFLGRHFPKGAIPQCLLQVVEK